MDKILLYEEGLSKGSDASVPRSIHQDGIHLVLCFQFLFLLASGLGDPKGLMVDTENMAVVGKYLNQEPINCILFVLDLNYRVNITMRRLINIIVTKIHPADHDKLAVVINKYEHTPEAAKRRSRLLGGLDEVACRQQRIDMLIKAFSGETVISFLLIFAPLCISKKILQTVHDITFLTLLLNCRLCQA